MSKITTRREIETTGIGPKWFFSDARWSNGDYRYDWPNKSYPYVCAMQWDDLDIVESSRVNVRRWIDEFASRTVIYDMVDNRYRTYWADAFDYDASSEIRNAWDVFYFDNETDAVAFALRFSEFVRPLQKLHPTKHYGFIKPVDND